MNRREFIKRGSVLPVVLLPTVSYEKWANNQEPPVPNLTETLSFYNDIITALTTYTSLAVHEDFPIGSPGVIFKAPHGKEGQVYRGGAAYEIKLEKFTMGKFDPETFLKEHRRYRELIVGKFTEYISNKAITLNKTHVYMYPGSILMEPDFDFDLEGGPKDVLVVTIVFGLA